MAEPSAIDRHLAQQALEALSRHLPGMWNRSEKLAFEQRAHATMAETIRDVRAAAEQRTRSQLLTVLASHREWQIEIGWAQHAAAGGCHVTYEIGRVLSVIRQEMEDAKAEQAERPTVRA